MNNFEVFTGPNLSEIWREAFLKLSAPGISAISPVILEYTGFRNLLPLENPIIRETLDGALRSAGACDCHEVSSTIFPRSLWNPGAKRSAKHLKERYLKIWPRIKARSPANRRGVYFHRMIAYEPKIWDEAPIDQLAHVVKTYKAGNHRRSALVANIFDATRDHTDSRQQGFPCLQQVSFEPIDGEKLIVTGYYIMQYAFERAYGNLLGLGHLAQFMAHEMRLEVSAVRCIANTLRLGNRGKSQLSALARKLYTI